MTAKKIRKKKVKPSVSQVKSVPTPITPPTVANDWEVSLWPYLIIMVSAFVIYFQGLNYDYVLDDKIVITGNSFTKKGFAGIHDIFTTESFTGYFGEQKDLLPGSRYRPLSIVTFAIEYGLFGENKTTSHFINILLYGLCCMLLYYVFRRLLDEQSKWYLSVAFIATLLYTLHPLHTEAVANIKGRDEIMAFLFSLLSLHLTRRYVDKGSYLSLGVAGFFLFLGILSKEIAIIFVGIIPLTLYFFSKASYRQLSIVFVTLLVSSFIYLGMRYNAIGFLFSSGVESNDLMNNPFLGMNLGEKSATIAYTLSKYLQLGFVPHPLTHDYYPYQIPIMNWTKPTSIISAIIHLALFIYAIVGLPKKNIYSYMILFYLGAIALISNVLFTVGTFMNERFLFIGSFAICLFIAHLLMKAIPTRWPKFPRTAFAGIGLLLAIGFGIKGFLRVPAWKDTLTLNQEAIKVSTNSARSNSFMATALYNEIQTENDLIRKTQMIDDLQYYADRATTIFPGYGNGNQMKAGGAAERYKLDNDLNKLLATFKEVAVQRPDTKYLHQYFEYLNGRNADRSTLINFYYDIGYNELSQKQGRHDWGARYIQYALTLDPNNSVLNNGMSSVRRLMGR